MGEVYRACDGRLKREVAIKVLAPQVLNDPEYRARFEREARAASALNHPNIITVHDVGFEQGVPYIVSELVGGDSLRKLLRDGPIPLRKLLDVGAQIADGLAAAHQAGIVHRDLKPENIMVTREGRVKILDFGLAKSSPRMPETSTDETATATRSGLAGTPAYMSPEQGRGTAVDFHADQFSFGLILYEMAAGRHPFRRDTPVQTLSAIIADDVPPLGAAAPEPLAWVIDRCLAKEPHQRYGSSLDLYYDLRSIRDRAPNGRAPEGPVKSGKAKWLSRRRVAFAAGTVLGLVLGSVLGLRLAPAVWPAPASYAYRPIATETVAESFPAWSPDGKTVAYSGEVDGVYQVFMRSLVSPMPAQLTKAGFDCLYPFWSASGTHLFYLSGEPPSLWSVSTAGGESELISKDVIAAAMSPDGSALVLIRGGVSGLWVSSADGSGARKIASFDKSGLDGFVHFSPDGKKIGAWVGNAFGFSQLWIFPYPADGKAGKQAGQFLEKRFQPGARPFSWLPDSHRIVFGAQQPTATALHLWSADLENGNIEPVTVSSTEESYPAVAPDGHRIAFVAAPADWDVVEIPIDGGPMRPLISTPRYESWPAWSPLGPQLVYTASRNGLFELWVRNQQDGSERPVVTGRDFTNGATYFLTESSISPDGRWIAYQRNATDSVAIWLSAMEGGPPVPLAHEQAVRQDSPTWSPDGKWIAYVSLRGDQWILAKARVGSDRPPMDLKEVVGNSVQWSPRGDWIACVTSNGLDLVSPDGHMTRHLTGAAPFVEGWSKNGDLLYAIRKDERRHLVFFSIEIASGRELRITDLGPAPLVSLPYRTGRASLRGFSRAPDGKSFATSILRPNSDVWMLDAFEPRSFWDQIWSKR
jgi:Tol biopolymer transport system component